MSKVYTVDEIKNIIQPIVRNYGVEKVYLFGSYARGEATEDSDIDLRIDKGKIKGLIVLSSLYNELEDRLQKKLDLLTTGSLDSSFLHRISPEEILIYEN